MRAADRAAAQLLERASAGDEAAFGELVDPYRRELQLHCYRILGSVEDAEDLLQETLLAAWRGLDRYEGRASLRAWLYGIATNHSLNALRDSARRPRDGSGAAPELPEPTGPSAEPVWLQPLSRRPARRRPRRRPGSRRPLRAAGGGVRRVRRREQRAQARARSSRPVRRAASAHRCRRRHASAGSWGAS